MLYRQTAGLPSGHMGQRRGAFEHGEDEAELAGTAQENLAKFGQVIPLGMMV